MDVVLLPPVLFLLPSLEEIRSEEQLHRRCQVSVETYLELVHVEHQKGRAS